MCIEVVNTDTHTGEVACAQSDFLAYETPERLKSKLMVSGPYILVCHLIGSMQIPASLKLMNVLPNLINNMNVLINQF
jgi:hypothetical protein